MHTRGKLTLQEWRTFVLLGSSIIPLVLGGAIYLLWRDTSLLMFRWLEELHLLDVVVTARAGSTAQSIHLPDWALYSLPNALWVLSLVSVVGLLWRGMGLPWLTIAVVAASALGAGAEVAQGLELIGGTFSMTDLVLAALGAAAGGAVAFLGGSHAT